MMPCPKCGGKAGVKDTRLRISGRAKKKHVYVWRRRVCFNLKCKFRWTTVEGQNAVLGQEGHRGGTIIDRAAYDLCAQILTKLASEMRRVKTRRRLRQIHRMLTK